MTFLIWWGEVGRMSQYQIFSLIFIFTTVQPNTFIFTPKLLRDERIKPCTAWFLELTILYCTCENCYEGRDKTKKIITM